MLQEGCALLSAAALVLGQPDAQGDAQGEADGGGGGGSGGGGGACWAQPGIVVKVLCLASDL